MLFPFRIFGGFFSFKYNGKITFMILFVFSCFNDFVFAKANKFKTIEKLIPQWV